MKRLDFVFKNMIMLFRNTKEELFANECSREETTLHFFTESCSEHIIYIDEQLNEEIIKDKKMEDIYKIIEKKFKCGSYFWGKSEQLIVGDEKIHIYWVMYSKSLEKNTGYFLLKCVFEELTKSFNEYLNSLVNIDGKLVGGKSNSEWSDLSFVLIQCILHEAEVKTANYLEKLFAPLDLQMITGLSGEYYEKAECQSNMIFLCQKAVNNLKDQDFIYRFYNIEIDGKRLDEINFIPQNIRLLRKLLQIAQKELCLVLGEDTDKKIFRVLGIVNEKNFCGKFSEITKVVVKFKRHMHWDLFVNKTYIITYRSGHYKIERPIDEDYLHRRISEYFGEKIGGYKSLISNILLSIEQEHGTMLVVMEEKDIHEEVKRLGYHKFGLPESPPKSILNEMNQLNNIDGSVFIDISGKVHGIGMILDGTSEISGNLARGARYNSAEKYKAFLKKKKVYALILIISEDGIVNILQS